MTEHIGLHTRLLPGAEEEYDALHRKVWPDVLAAIAELASDPVNVRWQATVAPLMAKAHDYSGESSDRLPVIFELGR